MNDDDWYDHDIDDDAENDEDTMPCPYCGRAIYDDTVQCPHCHMYIENDALPGPGPAWLRRVWQITAIVMIVVLLVVWLYFAA